MLVLFALACTEALDPELGPLGEGLANPFPNAALMTGGRVAIPADLLPRAVTPLPVERLAFREGFSPGQPSVVFLDDVDAAALPAWRTPTPGAGGVLLADLDAGGFLPVMAELDAFPDQDRPALIVRPMVALPKGHRIAVAVTAAAAPRPAYYDEVLGGRGELSDHHRALVADLEALGATEISVAWDFPVSDASVTLTSALAQVEVPGAWTADVVREAAAGDRLPPGGWRAVEGSFTVQDFLIDDLTLPVDAQGAVPAAAGETEAYVYVYVPDAVKDAPAGSVPILLFGHGIFGHPTDYLDDREDEQQVARLANELGAIVVATTWRGLESDDRLEAIGVAQDFGRFPLVPDRLVQGHANVRALIRLVREGALLDDPLLAGAQGQAIGDRTRMIYYGISLGGIEGTVLLAQDSPIDAAVLHVPGGMWSTMLERSTHWPPFELFMTDSLPEPGDRQLLYAASQLFWDPVDPIHWVDALDGKLALAQESLGDEQVANLTTRAVWRSVGVPALSPPVEAPWGLSPADGPLVGSAFAQFDPEVGVPEDVNRPPRPSGAHSIPRTWPGARIQALEFLTYGQLGTVVHACGDAPCSASNPGVEQ